MDYLKIREEYLKHTNELYHHGILGQKWGIRRYQNPDGSLTPEGKARYGQYIDSEKTAAKVLKEADKSSAEINKKIAATTEARKKVSAYADEMNTKYDNKLFDIHKNYDADACERQGVDIDFWDNEQETKQCLYHWAGKLTKEYKSWDKEQLQKEINTYKELTNAYQDACRDLIESIIGEWSKDTSKARWALADSVDKYVEKKAHIRADAWWTTGESGLIPEESVKKSVFAVPNWYGLEFSD